jgi:hypothetical protein
MSFANYPVDIERLTNYEITNLKSQV